MKRKSEKHGFFAGLTFTSTMIVFGVLLAAGAITGLVVSQGLDSRRSAGTRIDPPIRAVHIKPDLEQIKRQQSALNEEQKRVMMSPAMLRQVGQLEQRLTSLEGQIRSLSKSSLDLAEKVETSGIDTRLQALEDSLKTFTASIDKRIEQTARREAQKKPLPSMNELSEGEKKLLPPPFKTDRPVDRSVKTKEAEPVQQEPAKAAETQEDKPAETPKTKVAMAPSPEPEEEKIVEKIARKKPPVKKVVEKHEVPKYKPALIDISKAPYRKQKDPLKTGWEPTVVYHNTLKQRMASAKPVSRHNNIKRSSPEITGSLKQQGTQSAKTPAPVKRKSAPKKPFAVHIGSATNLYRVKDSWLTLRRDHGILRGLRPHIVSTGAEKKGAVPWKLLAGPVKSEDEAARICSRLNAKGNFCRRTTLSGTPLKY